MSAAAAVAVAAHPAVLDESSCQQLLLELLQMLAMLRGIEESSLLGLLHDVLRITGAMATTWNISKPSS